MPSPLKFTQEAHLPLLGKWLVGTPPMLGIDSNAQPPSQPHSAEVIGHFTRGRTQDAETYPSHAMTRQKAKSRIHTKNQADRLKINIVQRSHYFLNAE